MLRSDARPGPNLAHTPPSIPSPEKPTSSWKPLKLVLDGGRELGQGPPTVPGSEVVPLLDATQPRRAAVFHRPQLGRV